MSLTVKKIDRKSIASDLGIRPGYILETVNNEDINDIIDYEFFNGQDFLELNFKDSKGNDLIFSIEKDPDEDIGIEFENSGLEKKIHCRNHCIFCFVDQLPKNSRKSLKFKDDDWRYSFLMGNYITLTNISDKEIDRIIKRKISPLYLSVHSTDNNLRKKILGVDYVQPFMSKLKLLIDNGIKINAQIVMCKDINDGQVLEKSISDLMALYPGVESIAVVPVGLTRYRNNLFPLKAVDRITARNAINIIKKYSDRALEQFGTHFVYASDEMYIRAGLSLPEYDEYDDFSQIENGVGLIRMFQDDIYSCYKTTDKKKYGCISLVTGVDFYPFMREITTFLSDKFDMKINLYEITNRYLGETITVTGLLSGQDIIEQLKDKDLGEALFVPSTMFNSDNYTIDDLTPGMISEILKTKCIITDASGYGFYSSIIDS